MYGCFLGLRNHACAAAEARVFKRQLFATQTNVLNELREQFPDVPILVLVQPFKDQLVDAVKANLTLTLSDWDLAEALGDIARKLNQVVSVHCEIDTGMGRLGFQADDVKLAHQELNKINQVSKIRLMTHFANADLLDDTVTQHQLQTFQQARL